MSEDRLERALDEMKDGRRGRRHDRDRPGARLGEGGERRRRRLCGVPPGLPGVSGQGAWRQPPPVGGRPSQPLPQLSHADRRDEGRENSHRHARCRLLGSRWVRRGMLAAAAALLIAVVYVGRDTIDAMMAPGGPRATVVSAEGGLYRVAGKAPLEAGAAIGERESVRTGPGAHAVLRLADGSTVDVNERTELFVTAAWSGQAIHLQRGDIIVKAAKQRRGQPAGV